MKRILFSLLAVAIVVGACRKESVKPATLELNQANFLAQKDASNAHTFTVVVSNSGEELGTVNWEHEIVENPPAEWALNTTIGTDDAGSSSSGSFELAAGSSQDYKLRIDPNGTTGNIRLKVTYSLAEDPTVSQTATFSLEAVNTPKGVVITLSDTLKQGSGSYSVAKEHTISVSHDASVDANIAWRRVDETLPTGWTLGLTDPSNTTSSAQTGNMTISSGSTGLFKVKMDPNSNEGNASTTILFYVTTDSAATVKKARFTYNAVNSTQPSITLSSSSFSDSGDSTTAKTFNLTVNYDGPSAGTIQWKRMNETIPSGWNTSITEGSNSASSNMSGSFSLTPASNTSFDFMIDPQSVAGTGTSTIIFYVEGDSANTVEQATFEYTANGNTSGGSGGGLPYSLSSTTQSGSSSDANPALDPKIYITVTNETSSPLELAWRRMDETGTTVGWDIYVCFGYCYGPAKMAETHTIPANGTEPFEVHYTPNGLFGQGHSEIVIFDPTDSLNTVQTMTFDYTVSK